MKFSLAKYRRLAGLAASVMAVFSCGRLLAAVDLLDAAPVSALGGSFPLVANGVAAPIVIPPGAPEVVKIAARDLAADVESVSGKRPEVLAMPPADVSRPRVQVVFAPELAGRWEAFRLSASSNVLTVAGADRRAIAYGLYELSRRIGVSPWHWWADVPVVKHSEILLSAGVEPVDQPAVKYRGIFINDEDWGLRPWASKTYEPATGNIGPKTYARVFELLLRLRANTIWPAMHPGTTPFFLVPGNADMAGRYAIVVGSSHAEPMLRNNVSEWTEDKKLYDYSRNPGGVLAYWEQRVRERTNGESLFTLGMRGIHDGPIRGYEQQSERIPALEKIIADQRALLAKYPGHGSLTNVAQVFCPYKEVLDDYDAGLRVPEDVTLVWPDDNFGYVRHFATPAERARSGGNGVYYHASYLGAPFSWVWIDTLPPALIWSEMIRAYEQGARTFWIVNVGDIKNTERSMEFFLDLAWHAGQTSIEAPVNFMRATAARDFGRENADKIVGILKRLQAINFARKAEHLQWHDSLTPYKPTGLNETEIHERLKACADLQRDSDALAENLPAEARDAYFELVGYPVAITAAVNERYFRSELARADIARARPAGLNLAAAKAAEARITQLTAHYNDEIAGGKWRYIVTEGGVARKAWERFQPDRTAPQPDPALTNVCPGAPPEAGALTRPPDARPGDFVESGGVIAIDAGHFSGRNDLPSGAGWRVVPGLGRTGSAVTVLPSTSVIVSNIAPSLEYRFHVGTGGLATLRVRLLPTYPLVTGRGLRLAVAIDDGARVPLVVAGGFDVKEKAWSERVLANATETTLKLTGSLSPGWHTLRLIAVDAGVVVDKIVFDFGGLCPSYDGPAETRLPL